MIPVNFPAGIGVALAEELVRQGVRWRTLNGQLEVSDAVLFNSIASGFDQATAEKPRVVEAIRAEAQRRIFNVVPQWRQNNLTARASELIDKGRGNWSAAELAEWNAGKVIWDRVKALRQASNVIEARLASVTKRDAVIGFDVVGAAEWPE